MLSVGGIALFPAPSCKRCNATPFLQLAAMCRQFFWRSDSKRMLHLVITWSDIGMLGLGSSLCWPAPTPVITLGSEVTSPKRLHALRMKLKHIAPYMLHNPGGLSPCVQEGLWTGGRTRVKTLETIYKPLHVAFCIDLPL